MSLFRKNSIKKKTWDDITVKQFYQLASLGKEPKLEDLLKIVYDINLKDIPIKDISKYDLSFIGTDVKKKPIKKSYTINGTKYSANFELPNISTAQFFDFRNYAAKNDFVGVLSCCLIPEGKEYNDEYNIEQVKKDIEALPITQAQTIGFFFLNQSVVLLEATRQSSLRNLKEKKNQTEVEEAAENLLEKLDLLSLTSYH